MISAVDDASGTTWSTVPKRVLSWWWSMLRIRAACLSSSAGLRSMLPQSRNTTVRSSTSSGTVVTSWGSWMKRYS